MNYNIKYSIMKYVFNKLNSTFKNQIVFCKIFKIHF